MTMMTYLWQVS